MIDKVTCLCEICRYGRKVQELKSRVGMVTDQKLIDELYERMALAEDDNSMLRFRASRMRQVLHALYPDHFLTKGDFTRLDGHANCRMCELLEGLH